MFYKKLMNKHMIRFVFAFNKANYETHSQIFTQTRLKRMRLSFKNGHSKCEMKVQLTQFSEVTFIPMYVI